MRHFYKGDELRCWPVLSTQSYALECLFKILAIVSGSLVIFGFALQVIVNSVNRNVFCEVVTRTGTKAVLINIMIYRANCSLGHFLLEFEAG